RVDGGLVGRPAREVVPRLLLRIGVVRGGAHRAEDLAAELAFEVALAVTRLPAEAGIGAGQPVAYQRFEARPQLERRDPSHNAEAAQQDPPNVAVGLVAEQLREVQKVA